MSQRATNFCFCYSKFLLLFVMSLENVAGEKECERSIFSSSQYGKKEKTFVSISLRELWENRNNKQQQQQKKTKNKIHRQKKNTQEKQENVEEKSKRLNFNAAIPLAWRGRVHGKACQEGTRRYWLYRVQGTGCIQWIWQCVRRMTNVLACDWCLIIQPRAHKVLFLKPFYKCLQCCVICNWIRVQHGDTHTANSATWRHNTKQQSKEIPSGGTQLGRERTHGLLEEFCHYQQ